MLFIFPQKKILLCAAVVSAALLLAACGADDDAADAAAKNEPIDALYSKALSSFSAHHYKDAIDEFEEVERQYPYSEWAGRAELMAAYSGFLGGQFDDAVAILDRYTKLHPTDTNTPYAYYLKAMCYYTQIVDVGRDQKTTELARDALKDIIARYPDTSYAQDAKLKLDLVDDHLAGKEMNVGRYYQRHQEYIAAINRFKFVVEQYQTTSHAPEALHRLVECYLRLGVAEEAKKYAAVLGYNYPDSIWYQYSYEMIKGNLSPEEQQSFLDRHFKR
ncbi:MAG: outer membrane protein assembly factor BamD [Rhodospirillales bacterium 12-54-5]|nr:MAG: outer membrane protein assembly factor BamD [Rhodospirillales bacterium 12-54-5]